MLALEPQHTEIIISAHEEGEREKARAAHAQLVWLAPAWLSGLPSDHLGHLCFPLDIRRRLSLKEQLLRTAPCTLMCPVPRCGPVTPLKLVQHRSAGLSGVPAPLDQKEVN